MEPDRSLLEHEHQAMLFLTEDKEKLQIEVVRSGWFRLGRLRARRFVAQGLKDNKPMIAITSLRFTKAVSYGY
jgi:hypothetical protein